MVVREAEGRAEPAHRNLTRLPVVRLPAPVNVRRALRPDRLTLRLRLNRRYADLHSYAPLSRQAGTRKPRKTLPSLTAL